MILSGLLAAAFWPVWIWYAERTADGSDEPYGILALAAGIWLVRRDRAGTFVAWNEDAIYRIEERISNGSRDWSGVSQWFWSASLGRTEGPWWAATVIGAY